MMRTQKKSLVAVRSSITTSEMDAPLSSSLSFLFCRDVMKRDRLNVQILGLDRSYLSRQNGD